MEDKHRHEHHTSDTGGDEGLLASVAQSLCEIGNGLVGPLRKDQHGEPMPSRDAVVEMIEATRSVLFPGYFGLSEMSTESMRFHIGSTLDRIKLIMAEQIKRGICFLGIPTLLIASTQTPLTI